MVELIEVDTAIKRWPTPEENAKPPIESDMLYNILEIALIDRHVDYNVFSTNENFSKVELRFPVISGDMEFLSLLVSQNANAEAAFGIQSIESVEDYNGSSLHIGFDFSKVKNRDLTYDKFANSLARFIKSVNSHDIEHAGGIKAAKAFNKIAAPNPGSDSHYSDNHGHMLRALEKRRSAESEVTSQR